MLVFRNPGLIDLTAATTLGVNVKDDPDTAIGQFGTGLKCAISIVLRLGGEIEIWRGRKLYSFGVDEKTIRGKKFRVVTMNGRSLGFVDTYAAHWEPWMAYRELWSNARDEGGEVVRTMTVPDVAARTTMIVVRCRELETAHDERHKIVIQTSPLLTLPGEVDVHAGESEFVYYKGIRVTHVPNKRRSLYTYCLRGHQHLTEDRTLAYTWVLPAKIASALVQCTNKSVISDVLTAGKDYFEHYIPWKDAKDVKPSPQFMEEAEALRAANKLTGSALDLFKSYLDTMPGYRSPYIVVPTALQEALVEDALAMLDREGAHFRREALAFKSDRGYLGVGTEGDLTIVPAEELGGSALELARSLLVHWYRSVNKAGQQGMAHRILTGEVPGDGYFKARAKRVGDLIESDY